MLTLLEGAAKIVFPQKVEVVLRSNLLLVPAVFSAVAPRKLKYDHRGKVLDTYV